MKMTIDGKLSEMNRKRKENGEKEEKQERTVLLKL